MDDHVFLKVMPKRGVVRFGNQGKLAQTYIGPIELLKMMGTIAYQLALPSRLSSVHEVFHLHAPEVYSRSRSCSGLGRDCC